MMDGVVVNLAKKLTVPCSAGVSQQECSCSWTSALHESHHKRGLPLQNEIIHLKVDTGLEGLLLRV